MIGTNNIGLHGDSPEDVAKGVCAILSVLQKRFPKSEVLLHSIFPRGRTPEDPMRKAVEKANRILETYGELASVTWVPLWDPLLEPDGTLPASVMPDALHPNARGYRIWSDAVTPEIRRALDRTRR